MEELGLFGEREEGLAEGESLRSNHCRIRVAAILLQASLDA